MTAQFTTGDRVVLTQEVDIYPIGNWFAGETGTIVSIQPNLNGEDGLTYMVKLDRHYPALKEWCNELQIDCKSGRWGDEAVPFGLLPTFDSMVAEYVAWNKAQGLNLGSADEHLFDDHLTQDQRMWLHDFTTRWEAMEESEREAERLRERGETDVYVLRAELIRLGVEPALIDRAITRANLR